MHGHVPKLIKRFGNSELLKEYLILKPDTYENTGHGEYADVKMPEGYKKLHNCPKNSPKYSAVMRYLSNRRIGPEIIEKFDIGYTVIGEFENRIIIPSYDAFGELNYFIARAFSNRAKPKYLNPEAEKQEIIFSENKINWDSTIYLVEGVFDHIVIPNSIPLLGKFISPKLFNEIYNKASANIVIVLDSDAYDDALELYKTLNIDKLIGRIKICIPLDGFDPSLIYQKYGSHGIIELLKASRRIPENQLY
jgi:DNA primase